MKEPNFKHLYVLILLLCSINYIQGENKRKLEEENYIIAYYIKDVTYNKGFVYGTGANKIETRESISTIKLENSEKTNEDLLEIKANTKVEIYFSSDVASIAHFFNANTDTNAQHLVSVDLSHFDATQLSQAQHFLSKCTSLKTFIKPKTTTNNLENMTNMFRGCSAIETIDLSNLQMEKADQISNMFYECKSLKSIDLSNLNFQSLDESTMDPNFLIDLPLRYVNLQNFKATSEKVYSTTKQNLEKISDVIICGGNDNFNLKDICCNFDIEKDQCDNSNYMSIYYNIEKQSQNFPLLCEECFENIGYIMIGDIMYSKYDKFNISKETKIEIHFADPLTNLSNFFNGEENLVSVDLSNLNSSKINDMSYLFNDCTSLNTINISNINTSLVINMSSMFAGCSSLNILNLSNFYTPLLINMNQMFYGCDSLTSLDISNFDMQNCNNYEKIFSDITTIKYINIYNFKNDKILSQLFKEANDIIVCQSENIITSPNAIYCCDYDFGNNKCLEPILTTILTTTLNIIPTTIPVLKTTTPTLINEINDTSSTTNQIVDDIYVTLILIGFSGFRNLYTSVNFYIYFYNSNPLFYSKNLNFPVIIESNRVLRHLETYEANCEITGEKNKDIHVYYCNINAQIQNIKSVKIIDINQFQFSSFNSISFISLDVIVSPLAEIFMDNIQNCPDKLEALKNSTSYILEHSKIHEDKDLYFNISGIINQKPKFGKNKIKLMTYTKYENQTLQADIDCDIIDIINYTYILNCKGNNGDYYNFQYSLSFIIDEILIIIFDNDDNSTISFEATEKIYNKFDYSKKKGNLSAGAIAAIVLALVFAIVSVIVAYICLKKDKYVEDKERDSTVCEFKN